MNAAWYLSKSVVRIIVMEFRIIVSVIYAETPDNQTKEEKAAESKKLLKEAVKIAKIQQELPGGFGATLIPSHTKKPFIFLCVTTYHIKGTLKNSRSCRIALFI